MKQLCDALFLLLVSVFVGLALAACSDTEELQIQLQHKRDLHDAKKTEVERKLEAIETGDVPPDLMPKTQGGSGFQVGTCVCTYRSGSAPPTSCSDSRCGSITYH